MEEKMKLNKVINLRVMENEFNKVNMIVEEAKDDWGGKKYESESHFCRCAVMKLIREELRYLR